MTPTHIAMRLLQATEQAKTLEAAGWTKTPCDRCKGSGTMVAPSSHGFYIDACYRCGGGRWLWTEPEQRVADALTKAKDQRTTPEAAADYTTEELLAGAPDHEKKPQEEPKEFRCPKCKSVNSWESIGQPYGEQLHRRCMLCGHLWWQ